MIELVVGITGLFVAIAVWLFPPEPLRRLFRIQQTPRTTAQPEQTRQEPYCEKFALFVETFPDLPTSTRTRILAWIDSLDDELLLVAAAMSGRPESSDHVGRSWISENSHPLGCGRSVPDLIAALFSAGVLAPSTEELVPGSYAESDAQRNPAFDYGRLLLDTWGILKAARAAGVFQAATAQPANPRMEPTPQQPPRIPRGSGASR